MKSMTTQKNTDAIPESISARIGAWLLCVYFVYIVIVWGFEAVDCICYELNIPQTTVISRIAVLIIFAILISKTRKYFELSELKINWKNFLGLFVIIVIGCLKSVYPDTCADTWGYHLIVQRPGFRNYFVDHFGKGFFQVYMFRLGDRLFTLFREILGFRYGTLLSTLILGLCYLQIQDLLKKYIEKNERSKSIAFKVLGCTELWAFIIVLTHYTLMNVGTYYIDILSFPIGIEVLRKLFETLYKKQNAGDIYYVAVLNGFWLALKMTNIVFIIPCVIMYIFLNRRHMTLKRLMISGLLAAIPCSIYLIVAFFDTGNPVFPFFNSLFQSPYYLIDNFKDPRWGGITLKEKLFWLVYLVYKPEYRSCEVFAEYTFVLVVGLLSMTLILLKCIIKVLNNKWEFDKEVLLAFLMIGSSILWSFTTGYARYYAFGMMLLGILAFYILNHYQSRKLMSVVISVVTIIALAETGCTVKHFFEGREFGWRTWSIDTFKEQCSKVLRDQEFAENCGADIDMFFTSSTGVAEMFDPEIYTYNVNYKNYCKDENIAEKELAKHSEFFEGNVYDIISRAMPTLGEYVEYINSSGMKIEELQPWETTVGTFELVKLSKQSSSNPNTIFWEENLDIKYTKNYKNAKLTFICGRLYSWETAPPYEIVVIKEDKKNSEIIYRNWVDNVDIKTYTIDLGNIDEETNIRIEFYDYLGNIADADFSKQTNKVFIINPQLQ